jgi:16S rRNA (cytidine1402-2'-O)-methyltransferase
MSDAGDHPSGGQHHQRSWICNGVVMPARGLNPGLHVVATPIGNLGDVTLRALSALAAADAILAEDTRIARRLTQHYGIRTRIRRFDAHAGDAQIAGLIGELQGGAALALVSDAGTPLLSDPGASLVMRAAAAGVKVYPLPGASALLAALVTAGLPADRFFFEGFLPPKSGDRKRRLRTLAAVPGALVFYEAPHRVPETLADLQAILGDRPASAARELTKLYETVVRGPLSDLAAHFEQQAPRGEFVIVVAPPPEGEAGDSGDIDARLKELMQGMSVKDAASVAAAEFGLPRREVYAKGLLMQDKSDGPPKR